MALTETRDSTHHWLLVEVVDDGAGVPDDAVTGVGLASLRRELRELGGRARIESAAQGGTRVRAWLPWQSSDDGVVVADAGATR